MEETNKWAIFYREEVIPVGNETIQWTRQYPNEIWGWFELELMLAWKNMFPLMEDDRRLGYLPLNDEA